MAKRGADIQLTDGNWDREEEPEQAGHFKVAGSDQLSKRVMKKAKRRVTGSEESTNSFKGFQGFGIPQNSSTPMINNTTNILTGFKGFGEKKEIRGEQVTSGEKTSDSAYMTQLKRLNQEVCEWIKKHISENPYVDLSPVFKDYERHLLNLEKKYPTFKAADEGGVKLSEVVSTKVTTFSVSSIKTVRGPLSTAGTPTLNGNSGISSSQANADQRRDNTEEADDTPKTQSQVKSAPEENAFYSIRCKLFFKRDDDWAELGVGMLSLKKIDEKIQVLIRNDTALGKILLNVFIGETTPTSRSGKNNVLLMSVPNPPVFGKEGDNTKPVSYLIRVKTAENADELQKHLQTAKNSA